MNPESDGRDHINIYSQGYTLLGRFLSNFHEQKIVTEDDEFMSVEGYWYWLGCSHKDRDRLRSLSGFEAKRVGRELRADDWMAGDKFQQKIKKAVVAKLLGNPDMLLEFKNSTLEFAHYYVHKGRVLGAPKAMWQIEFLERLRAMMQNPENYEVRNGDLFVGVSPKSAIIHSCNCAGQWGAGFAAALKARFPQAYEDQLKRCKENGLGMIGRAVIYREGDKEICSLFVSSGYGRGKSQAGTILVSTAAALKEALKKIRGEELHMPMINSGLFGVAWEKTEAILLLLASLYPEKKIVVWKK